MSYSSYSPPDSPYYYDPDVEDDYPYDYYDGYVDDLVYDLSVRNDNSESLELDGLFSDQQPATKLLPLKELCCRFVGQNFPFGTVQLYPSRVPEDAQKRISFWSFPLEKKKLLDYARVVGGAAMYDVKMARKTKVNNMTQSGMYLTGTVLWQRGVDRYYAEEEGEGFRAFVQFDRGCITGTKCSCGKRNWCSHVLALCLARMNESAPLQLHPPISETLANFDREQLQKLVQYVLEKLPLHGVAAVQEIATSLLDRESEINQTSGAPDLTAGGCSSDKPVWQMDRNVIINRLNSAYQKKVSRRTYPYYESTSCLKNRKAALVEFKEFTNYPSPNSPSELHTLLLYEDDNLSVALKWALEKLSNKHPSMEEPRMRLLHQDTAACNREWSEWCFCRMLLPVVQMFFVSPAMSATAKEDVTECLAQCMQQDLSKPILELLRTFQQIATSGVFADAQGCRTLLTHLQQAVIRSLSLHPHDRSVEEPAGSSASLLHCAIAVVQYKLFYNSVCAPEIEDMPVAIRHLLFPAVLTDAAALEDLVAIRSDHGLQEMSVPLLLDYGSALLRCTSTPDLAAELVFKLIGNQLLLNSASNTDVLVFCNWAENAMIAAVDEAKTLIKASPEVKSKLASLSIKWLRQTSFTLERDPNPIATLTGMWSLMRLVCRCATDSDDCLEVVKQMTQELIGMIASILSEATSAPETRSRVAATDSSMPMEVMADSFTGLLVDLFTMLPAGGCQELFTSLYKVYPTPLDAKRSVEMKHYRYNDWQQCLLDGASTLSQRLSFAFFPKEPSMEDFEQQLAEASRGVHVFHQAKDGEQAEILQICRMQCSVSTSHISFLQQLHERLQNAGTWLRFQLQLLIAQVSNCVNYDWAHRSRSLGYGRCDLCASLLACDDIGHSLQVLKNVWKFSISPESVIELLEAAVHPDGATHDQLSHTISDILISVLDCNASHHSRIFAIMLDIDASPEHILQAVTLASSSSNYQRDGQHTTTIMQCTETLGRLYNRHKASGAAKEVLVNLRAKTADLLRQAGSIPKNTAPSIHLQYMYGSRSVGVDVQAVEQVVCDSGEQALADLLALVVMLPDASCLLPSLEVIQKLANYYHRHTHGGQSRPLQLPPFKETVTSLLERRKSDIKKMAVSSGETGIVRHLLKDLKDSFQFLEDEASFTTFEQDLAPHLRNSDRQRYRREVWPWGMMYSEEDDGEVYSEASVWQLMAAARARQMGLFQYY